MASGPAPIEKPDAAAVKERARGLGFDLCGIARARAVDRAAYDRWYANGWHADLSHMKVRLAERMDPRLLIPGAQSVIVVAASYGPGPLAGESRSADASRSTNTNASTNASSFTSTSPSTSASTSTSATTNTTTKAAAISDGPAAAAGGLLKVARYAQGRDYHNVLLKRARKLAAWLRSAGAQVYCEVDAGAVAEKFWAMEAGLGWIGKNGLLIHERFGSWLLLGALVTDLALAPDAPHPDRCGECSACIPACPTGAIQDGRLIDATRCLAYLTIETKAPIPPGLAARAGGRVFGCDACQEACPWNRRAREGALVELKPRPGQSALPLETVLALTEEEMRARFAGTPLMRAGREGLVRAALAVCGKPLAGEARALAEALHDDGSAAIRLEAARAIDAAPDASG